MFAAAVVGRASSVVPASPSRPLVVYYANEAAPEAVRSPNYRKLLAVLRQSRTPLAAELVADVIADESFFPAVGRRDIAGLRADGARSGFDLVVFTNALALHGSYLSSRGGAAFVARRFPGVPATRDTVLATSPLSRAEYLRAALIEAGTFARGSSAPAVLIANSHGSVDMALMPRVNADLSIATPAEVLNQLTAVDAATPAWATLKGTTKTAFWHALDAAGAVTGIHFGVVFREACDSGVASWGELFSIPGNVDRIADSAMTNLNPEKIDVAGIVAPFSSDPHSVDQVASKLRRGGLTVGSKFTAALTLLKRSLIALPHAVYFVPLILWVAWYVTFGRRVRPGRPAAV